MKFLSSQIVNIDTLSPDERPKVLLKLFWQFGHPLINILIALLKHAGTWREDYEETISRIEESSEICKRFARTPRPVVALPIATRFYEKWKHMWICT